MNGCLVTGAVVARGAFVRSVSAPIKWSARRSALRRRVCLRGNRVGCLRLPSRSTAAVSLRILSPNLAGMDLAPPHARATREIDMPPKAWSPKDERQYEHVKDSEREHGRTPKRAKEIAARTVNKQRRKEG